MDLKLKLKSLIGKQVIFINQLLYYLGEGLTLTLTRNALTTGTD